MKPPAISICIPTYNGREHLKECLDSVRAQSFKDFEVVVCDDGSSDGTLDCARELARGDERFRFIPNPRRFGLVGNWNNCIAVARGEWIKFVFQDDVIAPTCVEKLLHACEKTGKPFGFCARDFIFEDGTSQSLRKWLLGHQAKLDSEYLNRSAIEADEAGRMAMRNPVHNLVGEPTVTLIRKSLLEQVGVFDSALIQLCDAEFWFRIMSNFGAAWVPERLATFRVHAKAATAANIGSRAFRMGVLDSLVVRYRFAFDRHFLNLRSGRLVDKSKFALMGECSWAAYHAWREAKRLAKSEPNVMEEWKSATLSCPRLPLLKRMGLGIAGYRYMKRVVSRLIGICGFEWCK
jgi:glycosyltransferase involved in cell wall biosynthesis